LHGAKRYPQWSREGRKTLTRSNSAGAARRLAKPRRTAIRRNWVARQPNPRLEIENWAVITAAAAVAFNWTPWKRLRKVRGDVRAYVEEEWGRRIPRAYEEVLHAAMLGEPVPPIVLDILKAMTVMSPLSPKKLREKLADKGFPLPESRPLRRR